MRKLLYPFLICALLVGCNSKSKTATSSGDLVGNYSAVIVPDSSDNENKEALKAMMAMMANAKINYQFKQGGDGKYSIKMGAMSNETDIKWELLGADSLKINLKGQNEVFSLNKTENGFKLGTGQGISLQLTKE